MAAERRGTDGRTAVDIRGSDFGWTEGIPPTPPSLLSLKPRSPRPGLFIAAIDAAIANYPGAPLEANQTVQRSRGHLLPPAALPNASLQGSLTSAR